MAHTSDGSPMPEDGQTQHVERDFDIFRFRSQLLWLMEHRPATISGSLVRRTSKAIVQQIKAQHPNIGMSETWMSNLLSGNKHVEITLARALALAQVFGVDLDFFLDPDMERQRQMLLAPMIQLQQRVQQYEALTRRLSEARGEQILAALRGYAPRDLQTLEYVLALQLAPEDLELLATMHALPEAERAALEQLIRVRAQQIQES